LIVMVAALKKLQAALEAEREAAPAPLSLVRK
jgi:hypothetical protein